MHAAQHCSFNLVFTVQAQNFWLCDNFILILFTSVNSTLIITYALRPSNHHSK
jgi:hypothetical protein